MTASSETAAAGQARWMPAMIGITIANLVAGAEGMMVLVALHQLNEAFGDPTVVAWVITAHALVSGAALAIFGKLGDLWGHKRMMLLALAIGALGSAMSAFSTGLAMLIAGRAMQGVPAALLPLSLGIVRKQAPADRLPTVTGTLIGATGLGASLGLIAGGLIIDFGEWRGIFFAGITLNLVGIAVTALLVPTSAREKLDKPIDILGAILVAPAIGAILFAFQLLSGRPTDLSGGIWLAAGIALLAYWWRHELAHPSPIIDVRMLADRRLLYLNLCGALLAIAPMQVTQLQMLYLQQPVWTGTGLGLAATAAVLVKLPARAVTIGFAPVSGFLIERFGGRLVVLAGFVFCAVSWVAAVLGRTELWALVAALSLGVMIGCMLIYVGVNAAILLVVPHGRASEMAGVQGIISRVAGAAGWTVLVFVLERYSVQVEGHGATRYATDGAYVGIFLAIAAMSVVGMLLALKIPTAAAEKDRAALDAADGNRSTPVPDVAGAAAFPAGSST